MSTLREAEVFFQAGVRDLLYAVGISPQKLPQVAALRAAGCDLTVILDTIEQADALVEASRAAGAPFPALIEIDCDGLRGGSRRTTTPSSGLAGELANGMLWCRLPRGCGRLVCHAQSSASVRRLRRPRGSQLTSRRPPGPRRRQNDISANGCPGFSKSYRFFLRALAYAVASASS